MPGFIVELYLFVLENNSDALYRFCNRKSARRFMRKYTGKNKNLSLQCVARYPDKFRDYMRGYDKRVRRVL